MMEAGDSLQRIYSIVVTLIILLRHSLGHVSRRVITDMPAIPKS